MDSGRAEYPGQVPTLTGADAILDPWPKMSWTFSVRSTLAAIHIPTTALNCDLIEMVAS